VIGIFLNLNENQKNPHFEVFLVKFANLTDLHLEPFYELYSVISVLADEEHKAAIQNYRSTLQTIESKRSTKRDRLMSVILY
jgi:hypothetical protein